MRFGYFLVALVVLVATTASAVDSDREFGRRAVVKVDPANAGAKAYVQIAYSTANGTVVRRAALDSIFTMGGVDVLPSSTAQAFTMYQPVSVGSHYGTITVDDNLGTDPVLKITDSGLLFNGDPTAFYDDTSLWAKFADYMLTADHNAFVAATQVKFDNISTQVSQLKTAMLNYGVTLPGAAPASLSALNFGTITVSTTKTLTAQIDNTGLGNLVMGTVGKSGTGADKYTLNGGCSGQTVAPGGYCVESVTFAPGTVAGTYTAQISFPHNAQGSPTLMNVTGIGQAVQTCSTTPYKDISNITSPLSSPVGSSIYNIYNGIRIESGQAAHTICKIGARIGSVVEGGVTLTSGSPVGALSGINYRAEIWTTDGTGNLLAMKLASANVAAGSMVVGSDAVFQFAANVSLAATDAAIITRADHGYSTSNYINFVSGGTNTDGSYSHAVRYRDTLAVASEVTTSEKQFQLYEVQ